MALSFVCVTSEKSRGHFRFRSYESPWNQLDDVAIWQACRATSAAPTYFPPAIIGTPPVAYVDGALGYNNPIRALMDEVRHLWPNHGVGCIISIGTGVPAPRDVGRSIKPLLETLKAMSTDTERVAREVKDEIVYSHPGRYFRFNVQHGLEGVGLEEWKEMDRVKTVTVDYLQGNWEEVDLCASQLLSTDGTLSGICTTIIVFRVTKRCCYQTQGEQTPFQSLLLPYPQFHLRRIRILWDVRIK